VIETDFTNLTCVIRVQFILDETFIPPAAQKGLQTLDFGLLNFKLFTNKKKRLF